MYFQRLLHHFSQYHFQNISLRLSVIYKNHPHTPSCSLWTYHLRQATAMSQFTHMRYIQGWAKVGLWLWVPETQATASRLQECVNNEGRILSTYKVAPKCTVTFYWVNKAIVIIRTACLFPYRQLQTYICLPLYVTDLNYMFGKCVKFPVYRDDFIGFKNGTGLSLRLQFRCFRE